MPRLVSTMEALGEMAVAQSMAHVGRSRADGQHRRHGAGEMGAPRLDAPPPSLNGVVAGGHDCATQTGSMVWPRKMKASPGERILSFPC